MKFNGNPSADLGIDYHSFSEIKKDGKIVERYTLSEKVTPEVEDTLSRYENVKLVKNGASYRYAPEIKYDVLYISKEVESEEPVEEGFESFEDEHLGVISANDEVGIIDLLNEEVSGLKEQEETERFAKISSAVNMANNLALYYKELSSEFPGNSEFLEEFEKQLITQSTQLQGLLTAQENAPIATAGESVEDLPSEIVIELDEAEQAELADSEDENDFISDLLTVNTGFLHKGFNYEFLEQGKKIRCYDITWDSTDEDMAEESALDQNQEREAYNWLNSCFDEDSDLYDENGDIDFQELENRKKSSGYPIDLLNWINDCLAQMDDDGYSYEEFISFFGHYPGEGNWEPEEGEDW